VSDGMLKRQCGEVIQCQWWSGGVKDWWSGAVV
jgi:hypothetical protein